MPKSSASLSSGIRDNRERGSVADFLREKIQAGSNLAIVSAYFTIYAYEALKNHDDNSCRYPYEYTSAPRRTAGSATGGRYAVCACPAPKGSVEGLEGEIDQLYGCDNIRICQ